MSDSMFGDLPEGWEIITLGEVCTRGGGKIQTGPFGSQLHASDYVPTGVPTVMPANIGDNRIVESGIARIREEDAERLSRHRLQLGDIVYSRRGDVERRALVRDHEVGWLCGTGSLMVRVGDKYADATYVSMWLGHPQIRAWITQHAVGGTMANLNTEILSSVPVVVPPIAEQRAIAGVLGALDDKIESNRRLRAVTDELIRAALAEAGSAFDSAELRLGDVVHRVNEPVDPRVLTESTHYIGLEHMPRRMMFLDGFGTSDGLESGKSRVRRNDILFGKLRPNFQKVGVSPVDGICSTDVLVLRAVGPEWLALALLASDGLSAYAVAAASGTKMPRVSWEYLSEYMAEVPSEERLSTLRLTLDPAIARASESAIEDRKLSSLRDALLPELLSGRLRVRDAESYLEDAL